MGSDFVKKTASYVWPISKKVPSQYNGTLEICWYNGKKRLNSLNANYSYGSLEKVLVFGLTKLEILQKKPVLLLGLGGGCIISPLRKRFKCSGKITAVEWDKEVLNIASREFGIIESPKLNLVSADAAQFVQNCTSFFGLIIIDLFLDSEVPSTFYKRIFWNHVLPLVSKGGSVLFNAGINKKNDERIQVVTDLLGRFGDVQVFEKVQKCNTLILATQNP